MALGGSLRRRVPVVAAVVAGGDELQAMLSLFCWGTSTAALAVLVAFAVLAVTSERASSTMVCCAGPVLVAFDAVVVVVVVVLLFRCAVICLRDGGRGRRDPLDEAFCVFTLRLGRLWWSACQQLIEDRKRDGWLID